MLLAAAAPPAPSWPVIAALVAVLIFNLALLVVFLSYFAIWFQAKMTGLPIGLLDLIGMTFRKVNPRTVVKVMIMAKQAGIPLSSYEVQKAYWQGADLKKVTLALVRAKKEDVEITFQELVEADLKGQLTE